MKKTLSIHLGRQLFVIEEDAFDRLQEYLKRLEASLKEENGIAEIIEDIEMRFAELLMLYLGENRKVVTLEDVTKAIASLGEPEEISDESGEEKSAPLPTDGDSYRNRRLYRDAEGGVLGGVCSGIAAYLNIDPVIVRVAFIVFTFIGLAIPLYIVLWVIIPSASTPSERLQMHGKPVTVDSLKEEFTKAGERIQHDARKVRDRFKSGNEHIVKRTSHLAKLFGKLIGLGMVGLSFLWLVFFTLTITGTVDFIPVTGDSEYTSFHDFMQLVAPAGREFSLIWAGILLAGFCIPLLGILIGARLIIQRSSRFLKVNLIIFPLLIVAGMVCGLIGGLQTGRDLAVYAEVERQHLTSNAEQLNIEELIHYSNNRRVVSTGGIDFININHGKISAEGILITYRPTSDSLFHVYQLVSAHGVDRSKALKRSDHIYHTVQLLGQKLVVDPTYSYPAKDGFRDQEIEVIIEIPRNKRLTIKGLIIENPPTEFHGMLYSNQAFNPWEN